MSNANIKPSQLWQDKFVQIGIILIWSSCVHAALAQTALGTGFTYQGRLEESGQPVTGSFDLEFNLYDSSDPGTGTLLATEGHCGVTVAGGLFMVELDFGAAFAGDARWIEIGVASAGPCDSSTVYSYLDPLQPLTATPYALFALSGNQGPQGIQGEPGAPGVPGAPGDSHWSVDGTSTYYNTGNVGVGTASPDEKVEVVGTVKATAFMGDGSGLTGIEPGAPIVTEPTAHSPAFVICGTNAEQNPVQWSFVTSGRFQLTLEEMAYDVDVDFSGVVSMTEVALRIQDALRAATLGAEVVIWDTDHFVVTSGDTTPSSSISELTTHSSGLGIDISGAGAIDWMDCESGDGAVNLAVPNPLFYEGHLVLLGADGLVDPRFMSQNLQEADVFFAGTDISSQEAETLTAGNNADALHTHVSSVTAGSAANVQESRDQTSGGGIFHFDVPVGISNASTFELFGTLFLRVDPQGASNERFGRALFRAKGKVSGALVMQYDKVNSTDSTVDLSGLALDWDIAMTSANSLSPISLDILASGTSGPNHIEVRLVSVTSNGNNLRLTYHVTVHTIELGGQWQTFLSVRYLYAQR